MAKLTKAITGVPSGEIYPRKIEAGEDCPANLLPYAEEIGALADDPEPNASPEAKAKATAKTEAGAE